jgi:hypothetical protein
MKSPTGRTRETVPNIQNIPIRTEEGCAIRSKIAERMQVMPVDETVVPEGLCITPEGVRYLKEGPEIIVYLLIDQFGGDLWRLRHDSSHGRIEPTPRFFEGLDALQKTIEYCVQHTSRFGVVFKEGEALNQSESYWKWFKWWDGYYKPLSQNDDAFFELSSLLDIQGDVSGFRPKGSWNDE